MRPPLGTAHRRCQCDKDHLDQIVIRPPIHPRIGHMRKMLVDLTQQVRRHRFAPSSIPGKTICPLDEDQSYTIMGPIRGTDRRLPWGADAARLAGDSTDLRLPLAQRQFHNLHDAAAWIEQNWPDFDLETNHPMTWRTESP